MKTAVGLGLTAAGLVLVLAILPRTLLVARFDALERALVASSAARARVAFEGELAQLQSLAYDYGSWDATYHYMDTPSEAYLRDLPGPGHEGLGLHLLGLIDSEGRVRLTRSVSTIVRPASDGVASALTALRLRPGERQRAGLLDTPEGAYLAAAVPILNSRDEGPSRGTLVLGRRFDEAELAMLSSQAGAPVTLLRPAEARAAGGGQVREQGDSTMSATFLLTAVGGPPWGLQIRVSRDLHLAAQEALSYLSLALVLCGVVLSALSWGLLERLVFVRLRRLAGTAEAIAVSADPSRRVEVEGTDELSQLAGSLNRMLGGLEQSQGRLRDILEHSHDVFYAHGPDGRFTYLSPRAAGLFGDRLPAAWSEVAEALAGNRGPLARRADLLSAGLAPPDYELDVQGGDGSRRRVMVSEAPVVRGGRTVAVVGALSDVTSHRRAEEQSQQLELQLRQAQKMEAVGRLAGGVAHDFNNMLSVVSGYGELVQAAVAEGSPAARYVGEILRAADRAAGLTRQLLAFSRKQPREPRVVDVGAVVAETRGMLQRLLPEDMEMVCEVQAGVPAVFVDPGQLTQVVLNLAVNARDAMPGGGTLTLRVAAVEVGSATPPDPRLAPGRHVVLSVSDTGTGMDAETRERLFEPFFTTKAPGRGTGLGLATVHGIVSQNNGVIAVRSAPGHGSTFTVYLPAAAGIAEAASRPAEAGPGKGETILVVEDEPAVRAVVEQALTGGGYRVVAASGAEEARRLIEAEADIALLLSDVVMPGVRGPHLAAELQARRPGLRTLFMTGHAGDALSGLDARAVARLLAKPFTVSQLLARVRATIDAPAEEHAITP